MLGTLWPAAEAMAEVVHEGVAVGGCPAGEYVVAVEHGVTVAMDVAVVEGGTGAEDDAGVAGARANCTWRVSFGPDSCVLTGNRPRPGRRSSEPSIWSGSATSCPMSW